MGNDGLEPAAWLYNVGTGENYFVTRKADRGADEYWEPLDRRSEWVDYVRDLISEIGSQRPCGICPKGKQSGLRCPIDGTIEYNRDFNNEGELVWDLNDEKCPECGSDVEIKWRVIIEEHELEGKLPGLDGGDADE